MNIYKIVPSDHFLFPMFVPGDTFLFPRFVPGDTFLFPSFVPGDHILFPCFVPGDCFLFPTYSTVSPIQPIRFELCLIEPIRVVQKPLGKKERQTETHTENMEC